jgi:HK97 gp10 family phage protein
MELSIRVEGIEKLQNDLKGIMKKEKLEHALELGAIIVEREAVRRCPVGKTGHLWQSIQHKKIGELTQEVRASAEYADFVEYGTMYMQAGQPESPYIYTSPGGHFPSYRPYLRSALYDKTDQIIKLVEKSLSESNG